MVQFIKHLIWPRVTETGKTNKLMLYAVIIFYSHILPYYISQTNENEPDYTRSIKLNLPQQTKKKLFTFLKKTDNDALIKSSKDEEYSYIPMSAWG